MSRLQRILIVNNSLIIIEDPVKRGFAKFGKPSFAFYIYEVLVSVDFLLGYCDMMVLDYLRTCHKMLFGDSLITCSCG